MHLHYVFFSHVSNFVFIKNWLNKYKLKPQKILSGFVVLEGTDHPQEVPFATKPCRSSEIPHPLFFSNQSNKTVSRHQSESVLSEQLKKEQNKGFVWNSIFRISEADWRIWRSPENNQGSSPVNMLAFSFLSQLINALPHGPALKPKVFSTPSSMFQQSVFLKQADNKFHPKQKSNQLSNIIHIYRKSGNEFS